MAAFDFGSEYLDDLFGTTAGGRNLIFQTLLDRFRPPSEGFGTPSRDFGLVTDFNRSNINNVFGQQAQNEYLGATGRAIQQGQDAPTFTDFLDNDFDLGRKIRRAPSQQTGRSPSRFSGPSRFLFSQ